MEGDATRGTVVEHVRTGWDLADADFAATTPGEMAWKAMVMQPAVVTADMLKQAKAEVVRKKKDVPALAQVCLETWAEGLCAQTMYVGPYEGERPTIDMMHTWIAANGYRVRGRHHELYLGDPNRTAPEKLKTILQLPVEKGAAVAQVQPLDHLTRPHHPGPVCPRGTCWTCDY
jgi:hypothetical protein